jgi:L-aminopeptidase/D-esterase-like protein
MRSIRSISSASSMGSSCRAAPSTGWRQPRPLPPGSPYHALGRTAALAAAEDFALGNVGAGRGARAGALKGGLGSASWQIEGFTIGALAAVNSFGSVLVPGTRTFWAWPFEQAGELGNQQPPTIAPGLSLDFPADTKLGPPAARTNTTLGVVAVDAALTPSEAKRLAIMAQDGLARAIRPVHTPYDGDVVFAMATGGRDLPEPRALWLARLGSAGADCLARAIARGVYEAKGIDGALSYRDL